MAGLTDAGLEIKRLAEIVVDLKTEAVPIFQDLVEPGDVVDTSDSSTIGRFIGLTSLPLSDLWEAIQQVYLAFDPNSATGIALDNLVMYAGLTRNLPSPTNATVVVWGDPGTLIPTTQVARAIDNTLYNISFPIVLSSSSCIGARIVLANEVSTAGLYSINLNIGSTTRTATHDAGVGESLESIITSLVNSLNVSPASWVAFMDGNSLVIELNNIFDTCSITTSSNLNIIKIKARGEVRNQVSGRKEQDINSINTIATPMLGWDSITNPFPGVLGADLETDDELRERFRQSKYTRAINISDSLYARLLEIDGVDYVGIYENETDEYDSDTDLPPHSFKAVVQGGSLSDIALAIWQNKPLGIGSQGNTFGTIIDSQGYSRNIYFERPSPVRIYMNIELTVNQSTFPSDGIEQIKASLINYFNNNLEIGDDVIYSRMYTPINIVPGHQVNNLTIGTSPNPTGKNNIVIPYDGVASLSDSDITITIV